MKTIVSAIVALSVIAGIAGAASADSHTPDRVLGPNNSVNLP